LKKMSFGALSTHDVKAFRACISDQKIALTFAVFSYNYGCRSGCPGD
jgi:hypothetical protein